MYILNHVRIDSLVNFRQALMVSDSVDKLKDIVMNDLIDSDNEYEWEEYPLHNHPSYGLIIYEHKYETTLYNISYIEMV